MIELLNSNYKPLDTNSQTFSEVFFSLLGMAESVNIASGYISEDSIADLLGLYNTGFNVHLRLVVGMHYFEGLTYGQYYALKSLSDILTAKKLGGVYFVKTQKYHGKIYSFKYQNKISSIIGSSNLSKISIPEIIYDTDLLISDEKAANEIDNFIIQLQDKACINLQDLNESQIKLIEPENLFSDYLAVDKIDGDEKKNVLNNLTGIKFDIPLKDTPKSNLNCYFGEGRRNFQNGSVLPRDWYEVEIIVSNKITQKENYPVLQEFTVITDDNYKFDCKTSGDFSKNLRSAADLKILGRWIKGRMENRKALETGTPVTRDTFKKYKRDTITLTKTTIPDIWYLDFGVDK